MFRRAFSIFRKTNFLQKNVPFILADIGEGIKEVQIIQWYVKEGSTIRQFEKIAEVQSDKATVEITSRYDGIIKRLCYQPNEMAKVGDPLVEIETETEEFDKENKNENSSQQLSSSLENINKTSEKIKSVKYEAENLKSLPSKSKEIIILPSVRHFAKENNVDLNMVTPTGTDGRITKEDIIHYMKNIGPIENNNDNVFIEYSQNPIQKTMSRAMQESLNIPHFGYSDEYQFDNLLAKRKVWIEKTGKKISLMAFIVKAIAAASIDFPLINSHYIDGKVLVSKSINIGIAVDTPQGLVVPVLKDLEGKQVEDIAETLNDLTDRSRRNKLSKDDFTGATLTISNIGTIGGTYASPVIVPPQTCIGAIGKIRTVAAFNTSGGIEPHQMACFSWSADHRVMDGATMAKFSNRVKGFIENPDDNIV